jgi:sodium transport system permease protein
MSSALFAVFAKELTDSLRDRRSLAGALILPVMGPLMFGLMFTLLAEKHSKEKPVELPVVGREHAPELIRFLVEREVTIQEPPDAPDAAVRAGDVHAVLVIPEDFPERFRSGRPATLELVMDGSNDDANTAVRRVRGALDEYGRRVGALRLLARGVSPSLVSPLVVDNVDLATAERSAARVLGMIPMFALIAAFMGGMNVAIDATAGERERKSLEPLLINPASRMDIVCGKWLTALVHALVVLSLTLLLFMLAFRYVPLDQIGVSVEFGVRQVLAMFAIMVPVAPFSAALLMSVSVFARTFKEAQTYLSMMVFLPMLPGFFLMVNPTTPETWMMVVPTLAQNVLATELLRGEVIGTADFAISALSALLAGAMTLAITAKLFGRERIIFGR